MKLDELKKMIAEEFESYMKEDDVDVSVGADDVDLDDAGDMAGEEGEQNPEEALEKIYQMLQAYFEKDGEDNDMDGVEDEPGEEPVDEMETEYEINPKEIARKALKLANGKTNLLIDEDESWISRRSRRKIY